MLFPCLNNNEMCKTDAQLARMYNGVLLYN